MIRAAAVLLVIAYFLRRKPDIVADARNVPLPDESFDWIMADPPYSEEYAGNLYGTEADYPKPGQLLKAGGEW